MRSGGELCSTWSYAGGTWIVVAVATVGEVSVGRSGYYGAPGNAFNGGGSHFGLRAKESVENSVGIRRI